MEKGRRGKTGGRWRRGSTTRAAEVSADRSERAKPAEAHGRRKQPAPETWTSAADGQQEQRRARSDCLKNSIIGHSAPPPIYSQQSHFRDGTPHQHFPPPKLTNSARPSICQNYQTQFPRPPLSNSPLASPLRLRLQLKFVADAAVGFDVDVGYGSSTVRRHSNKTLLLSPSFHAIILPYFAPYLSWPRVTFVAVCVHFTPLSPACRLVLVSYDDINRRMSVALYASSLHHRPDFRDIRGFPAFFIFRHTLFPYFLCVKKRSVGLR